MSQTSMSPCDEFDPRKFPKVIALDTSAFILWAEGERRDADQLRVTTLLEAMIRERVRIVIPALVVGEYWRKKDVPPPLPNTQLIVPRPFDEMAAKQMAKFPPTVPTGGCECAPMAYWKMDAAIIATAERWEAEHILMRDHRSRRDYGPGRIKVTWCDDYLAGQTTLFDKLLLPSRP